MGKNKEKEKNTARILYCEQGKTAKEISVMLGITEKTIGIWVRKYHWKTTRDAKILAHTNRLENIYKIIENLASDRITMSAEISELYQKTDDESKKRIQELREQIARIDAAVANWNKTLGNISKENTINRLTFIQVMEIIFKHFDSKHPQFITQSIEFQEYMIHEIIETYVKD